MTVRIASCLPDGRTKLTPPQLGRLWGLAPEKILTWIRNGELAALNVATTLGGRPRWLIDVDEIARFEARRHSQPKRVPQPRRRSFHDGHETFGF